ncbi:MAG: hypothetical protein ACHQIM_10660 [Sphingobacteriales bacterium]
MENSGESISSKSVFNIAKITEYTTYLLVVGLTYSIAKMYFYYVLLLHVPIFQYVDTTELVLSFPTAIFLILYVGPIYTANYILKSEKFNKEERILFVLILYTFVIFLFVVAKNNDPVVQQFWMLPIKYWKYGVIPFLFYLYVMVKGAKREDSFFKKNVFIGILVFALWYGIFESFANYAVLTDKVKHTHFTIKLKSGEKIEANGKLIYAGRTKGYWFLYNRETRFVRALKNDDISIIDFDSILR